MRSYSRCAAVALMLVFAGSLFAAPAQVKTYKGEWFDIKYPGSFKVKPQQKSSTGQGYDAASFLSPDGAVEFYVFSPLWSGKPQWIAKRPGERTVSYSVERVGDRKIIYVTLRGNGYSRAYADNVNAQNNTRWTFGFKYKDAAAYQQYRPLYMKFKQSLQQYSD